MEEPRPGRFADRAFELRGAPPHLEIMADRNPAEPVVEKVGYGILAEELVDVVVARQPVEPRRKRRIAEVGRTGVVDHEIKRAAMVRRFRHRAGCRQRDVRVAERRCEPDEIDLRPLSDQRSKRWRKLGLGSGRPARLDMAQQAARLLDRRSGEGQRRGIEPAVDRWRGFSRRREQLGCGQQEGDHQIAPELRRDGETNTSSIGQFEQLGDAERQRQRRIVFAGLDGIDALARDFQRAARSLWLQAAFGAENPEAVLHQHPAVAPSVRRL